MNDIYKTLELMFDKIDSNNNNRYGVSYMAKLEYYYLLIDRPSNEQKYCKLNVPTICTHITNVNKKLNITNVLNELYQSIDKNILNNNIENNIFVLIFKNYYNCDPFEFNFTYDLIKATEEYLKDNTNDIFFIHQVCENADGEIIEINIYCYQNNVHKIGIISNNKIFNAIDLDMLYVNKLIKI